MEGIREAVERDLGYTTSAGIAHNKILAKLCAGHRKPRAQVRRISLLQPLSGKVS
jgi:DNA polymerase eta